MCIVVKITVKNDLDTMAGKGQVFELAKHHAPASLLAPACRTVNTDHTDHSGSKRRESVLSQPVRYLVVGWVTTSFELTN